MRRHASAMTLARASGTDVLIPSGNATTLHVADHNFGAHFHADMPLDMSRLQAGLSEVVTAEVDGASHYLALDVEVLLIAAIGRAIDRVAGPGRIVLDVAAAKGRTAATLAAVRRVSVQCVSRDKLGATAMLRSVRTALNEATAESPHVSEVLFSYGMQPIKGHHPGPAHALEVRAYRRNGVLKLDWWYATDHFEAYTVEELAEQFTLAAIELASESEPEVREPQLID